MGDSVTVIIPAHNAEATIERAVTSALAQEGCAVEVVVADDASTDGTAALVRSLAAGDGRVRLVSRLAQGGPGAARNAALATAGGDWIAVLDADDAFLSGRLSLLLTAGRNGADLVADRLRLTGSGGETIGEMPSTGVVAAGRIEAAAYVRANFFLNKRGNLGFLKPMVRRRLLETGRICYREDLFVCEDFHFVADCLLAGGAMELVDAALYSYTTTPGSLSRSLSRAEMARIHRAGAELTERVGASRGAAVREALLGRQRSLELAIAHRDFAEDMKHVRLGRAFGTVAARPAILPLIVRFGLESVRKRLWPGAPMPVGH